MNKFIVFLGTAVVALTIPGFSSAQDTSGCYSAFMKNDYPNVFRECQDPAKQEDTYSQVNLGFLYQYGEGVEQSYSEALKWYRKAADQGNAKAQFNLGVMYAKGRGLPENYVEAHRWTSHAADFGHQQARKNLKIIKGWMTPGQIAEVQQLATGGTVGTQASGWSTISRSNVRCPEPVSASAYGSPF